MWCLFAAVHSGHGRIHKTPARSEQEELIIWTKAPRFIQRWRKTERQDQRRVAGEIRVQVKDVEIKKIGAKILS